MDSMPYKDEGKQKEAERKASQEYRKRKQGMTEEGMTEEGMTQKKPLMVLSDGQVHDPNIEIPFRVPAGWSEVEWGRCMMACNISDSTRIR